tara:strand:- start:475 stop:909 length:435 start_codon:yes stop_codon:yes gene_type:complete
MAIDAGRYTRQRSSINEEHLSKQAANTRGRFLSQQRGNRDTSDAKRSYGRSHEPFMGQYAKRGLTGGGVRSGAFQKALRQRTGDNVRNVGRMASDQAAEQRSYDVQGANIDRYRKDALRSLEEKRQQEISLAALSLQALKPLYG